MRKDILFLLLGLLLGVVLAEVYFTICDPIVLKEGSADVVNDRDYFPVVDSMISGSQESIHAIIFSFQHYTDPQYRDSQVNSLIASLLSAKSRGLDVKAIVDDWPEGNEAAARYLSERGVEMRVLRDESLTTHNKLLIFDGAAVIVGSSNWSHFSIEKNHESNVLLNSEVLAQEFELYFNELWSVASPL